MEKEVCVKDRKARLETLFSDFVVPITNGVLTKKGIEKLAQEGKIILLPAVKEEIRRLYDGIEN